MVRVNSKIVVAIVAGFLAGGLSAAAVRVAQPDGAAVTRGMQREVGRADIGGPFHLVDQNRRDFTEQQLKGKPSLIVFGYTASPDLTPAALNVISQALDALGARANSVRVVFISLDWEHDRPDVLKSYLERFHPGIIGLTGSEKEIRSTASSFKIFLEKREAPDGSTEIDHSQLLFALDAEGNYVSLLRLPTSITAVTSLLRSLLA